MSDKYKVPGEPAQHFEGGEGDERWTLDIFVANTYLYKDGSDRVGVRIAGEFSPRHSVLAKGAVLEGLMHRTLDREWRRSNVRLTSFRRNTGETGGPHTAVGEIVGRSEPIDAPV